MIIIGIDPGKVTGMAQLVVHKETDPIGNPVYTEEASRIVTAELLGLWLTVSGDPAVVACEKYTITPGVKSSQPDALMVMGTTEFQAARYAARLYWQTPAQKKLAPDSLLRKLGWYVKTKDGHANDAIRHILIWLAINDTDTYARLVGV